MSPRKDSASGSSSTCDKSAAVLSSCASSSSSCLSLVTRRASCSAAARSAQIPGCASRSSISPTSCRFWGRSKIPPRVGKFFLEHGEPVFEIFHHVCMIPWAALLRNCGRGKKRCTCCDAAIGLSQPPIATAAGLSDTLYKPGLVSMRNGLPGTRTMSGADTDIHRGTRRS